MFSSIKHEFVLSFHLFLEDINIPVKVGDTILTGRFKNKKVLVKSIGKDEHGMPTINGKKVTTFRILKKQEENISGSTAASASFTGPNVYRTIWRCNFEQKRKK